MTPTSRRTLLWLSVVLVLIGGMVGSPEAGLAAAVLAALCTVPALLSGTARVRMAATLLLVVSAGLALTLLPAARSGMNAYGSRARRSPAPESR